MDDALKQNQHAIIKMNIEKDDNQQSDTGEKISGFC